MMQSREKPGEEHENHHICFYRKDGGKKHVKANQNPVRQTHPGDHCIAYYGAAAVAAGNDCG
jgi:hypothetical protein